MKPLRRFSVCAFGLIPWFAAGSIVRAQGTILHAVVADANTGDYLLDASVRVDPPGLQTTSDFFGDARFPGLRKGHYTVHVRRLGYAPLSSVIDLTGSDSAEITFMMRPLTHELATIKIEESATSPVLQEFEERRRRGTGQYVTDSVLRASPGALEDVITSRLRGLMYKRDPDGSFYLFSTRGSNSLSGMCQVSVYWNGVRITRRTLMPITIPLGFVGGIEFYNPGQVPAQYQEPGNDCGVLLLWPRP